MTDMHREAFEEMGREHGWHVQRIEPQVLGGSQYSEIYVSCAWIGWQAAMRHRDEQDAAGTPACAGCGEPADNPHTSDCPMVDRDEQEKQA